MDENGLDKRLKTYDKVIEVNDLKQYFPIKAGLMQRVVGYVKAVMVSALPSNAAKPWDLSANPVAVKPQLAKPSCASMKKPAVMCFSTV